MRNVFFYIIIISQQFARRGIAFVPNKIINRKKMVKIPFRNKIRRIRSLAGLWKYRSQLFSMFAEIFKGTYRASFITIVALVAAVIYLLSPFNLMTDMMPVIGWIDDGAVIYFVMKRLIFEVNRYESQRRDLNIVK